MHPALIFGQRDERRVPRLSAKSRGVVQRDAGIVAKFRTEQAVRPVFVENREVFPNPAGVIDT